MEFAFLLIGIAVGCVVAFLYFKSKQNTSTLTSPLEQKINVLEKEKLVLETNFTNSLKDIKRLNDENAAFKMEATNELNAEKEKSANEIAELRKKLGDAEIRIAKAIEAFKAQDDKLLIEKKEKEELQQKLITEFENIANKILDEKSQKFTDQNKTNLDIILNPLKEKIKDFEEKVDKTYKADSAERITLKSEIKNLIDLNKQVSEEANNLAKALKGDNKKQGNWGEVILEKILERSGLVKDQEYRTQFSTSNDEGKRIQPDVVVMLPDNKHIIIDSKVSLVAYEAIVNANDDAEREQQSKEHINSVRSHIKLLSEKNYQASADFNTPDFVLLFIPIESSFSIAVQADNELFNFAWERKIVIVSPSTLLATLRTISSVWKQERQTKNAIEIARQSGALYDKFYGFVEDMEKIGKSLEGSQGAYTNAINKLHQGSGNIVKRIEDIKKLGAKTTKSLSEKYIESSENSPIQLEQ